MFGAVEKLLESPAVKAVLLFGSRAREDAIGSDSLSDYDLQIVTTQPALFLSEQEAQRLVGDHPIKRFYLQPAFGGVLRVTLQFESATVDVSVVPWPRVTFLRLLLLLGFHRHFAIVRRFAGYIRLLLRGGYKVLKGGQRWERFYNIIATEVMVPLMDAAAVQNAMVGAHVLADSIETKLQRGELLAAQRWLHVNLAEIAFTLAHELRVRRGLTSFHDARRLEMILSDQELDALRVSCLPEIASIRLATRKVLMTVDATGAALLEHCRSNTQR